MKKSFSIFLLVVIFLAAEPIAPRVFAQQEEIVADINNLHTEVENKKANIDHLEDKIAEFERRIDRLQGQNASLSVEIELLENRLAKTELDIQATIEERELVGAELALLDGQMRKLQKRLDRNRGNLAEVIRSMHTQDQTISLALIFGAESFGEVFGRVQSLRSVQGGLRDLLVDIREVQQGVLDSKVEAEVKRARLDELHTQLAQAREHLEREDTAKNVLLAQSKQSEAAFQELLFELKQEQAFISQQLSSLQQKLEERIDASDALGVGGSVLSWPVDPSYRGFSALFHDPTYPFRHLFEHSGLDIPQPQGSALKAAAPGYVALARTGRSYGNYVMIVHSNGIATLYAHLSHMDVKPDQFVGRGQVIGATGGRPGTAGAGLSTGPHLHFEVRKQGVPVDPLGFLINN